jgi:RND family efflux transporter MFP subunit
VLRVIDPRRLEVVASVPLGESPRVGMGAPARLAATPTGTPEIALKVVSRPAQVEQGTATIPVRLAFARPTSFSAGVPVQVDIDAEKHDNVVLIPAMALVREGEETFVFVAKGGKAERRPVMIGISDEDHIEIRSGVKAGEIVVVEGQAGMPDGAPIATGETKETKPTQSGAATEEEKK